MISLHRLKPTHLRLVVRIADLTKLHLAAEELGMSQPAASRILAELEQQVGDALFQRGAKWMVPTAVGEVFIKHARAILFEFNNLEAEIRNLNAGLVGDVRVGAVTGPAVGFLVPAIRHVRATSPEIEATISVAPSADLVRELNAGNLDFAIARLPNEYDSRDFRIEPGRTETVSFMVRAGHPLAGRTKVSLEEMVGYEWVMQERGSPIRQAVDGAFLNAGLPSPTRLSNSSSLLVMLSLIGQSDVIAPQSDEVARMLTEPAIGARLTILEPETEVLVTPYFMLRSRAQELSRAAERVFDEVRRRMAG